MELNIIATSLLCQKYSLVAAFQTTLFCRVNEQSNVMINMRCYVDVVHLTIVGQLLGNCRALQCLFSLTQKGKH